MEDLSRDWSKFSLSERENTDFALPRTQKARTFVVAAKFLTSRFLVLEAVVRTFKQIWRSQNGFKIRQIGNHIVLFVFDNIQDVERILQNQPWTFDKHLVVLKRYEEGSQVKDLVFDKAWFWVQVHDIPLSFMSKKVAESLCDTVGEVRRSPESIEDDGGNFFRVRVNIDICLPLCRGRVITLENGEKAWVRFQYERLPNFCYWCGRLDHGDKQCNLWIRSKGSLSTDKQQFGSFLKVAPYKRGSKNVFYVPGWFEKETIGEEKGEAVVPGPVEAELGGKVINSNSFLNSESTTILGNDESLREVSVEEILSPVQPPSKLSELIPIESSFLSKLSEIDEDIRKFDSETSGKGGTPLSEAILPTDYNCSKSLKEVQNSDFPSEHDMIMQKENLVP